MTQNYHTVIALCFGPKSHSAKFLQDWGNRMYNNRLMYKTLQARDSTFFTQVLFCIERALQIHWHSCCNCEDRESVNDRVLFMSDKRDLIVEHNFTYNIPKLLQDKVMKPPQDLPDQDKGQKFKGKIDKDNKDKDNKNGLKSLKDILLITAQTMLLGASKMAKISQSCSTSIKRSVPNQQTANKSV